MRSPVRNHRLTATIALVLLCSGCAGTQRGTSDTDIQPPQAQNLPDSMRQPFAARDFSRTDDPTEPDPFAAAPETRNADQYFFPKRTGPRTATPDVQTDAPAPRDERPAVPFRLSLPQTVRNFLRRIPGSAQERPEKLPTLPDGAVADVLPHRELESAPVSYVAEAPNALRPARGEVRLQSPKPMVGGVRLLAPEEWETVQ